MTAAAQSIARLWPPLLAAGLATLRILIPERPPDAVGLRALADTTFALGLTVLLLYTARGLGRMCLRLAALLPTDPVFDLTLSTATGLAIVAYGVLVLGLLGWLAPESVLVWLVLAGAMAYLEGLRRGPPASELWSAIRPASPGMWAGCAAAVVVFGASLIHALLPVWDYDGLMYHLQAPALFLRAGRIVLLPDLWQANGPLLAEMLYLVGVAFESDAVAKVVHLSFAALLVLATFAVARRHVGDRAGWMAAGILLGVPVFPVWASLAYADMAWALYEVLAIAAYLEWRRDRRRAWLVVSAAMLGWAMGSKYPALALLPILCFAILFDRASGSPQARLRSTALFAGAAVLVAAPWYLKNLLLGGNPIYPFVFGSMDWPPERLQMLMAYLQSFGTGRSVGDYLLLPVSLFLRRDAFGTFMSRIDIPSPLFLLALALPSVRRASPIVGALGWISLVRFAAWAAGSQQTRFLLPLYPVLAVLAGAVLESWLASPRAGRRSSSIAYGVIGGFVGVTLAYQVIYWVDARPLPVVVGLESKEAFLRRAVYDYPAMRYVVESLPFDARVYFAWDGQGYYCDERCLPDAEQSRWVQLVLAGPSVQQVAWRLRLLGATHLLLDHEGLGFMLAHDPAGSHASAASFLVEQFLPRCLDEVFRDEKVVLYRLVCE